MVLLGDVERFFVGIKSCCQIRICYAFLYRIRIVSGLPVFSCFWVGYCGGWLVLGLLVWEQLQG